MSMDEISWFKYFNEPRQQYFWAMTFLQIWKKNNIPVIYLLTYLLYFYLSHLPFQHSKLLHWFALVSVSILCDQRILSIQGPAFRERRVISYFIKPAYDTATAIPEMFYGTLHLRKKHEKLKIVKT